MTFADKIINFLTNIEFDDNLLSNFKALNPYKENPETIELVKQFYKKYYDDKKPRKFIIGRFCILND